MRCGRVRRLLSPYIDDLIGVQERLAVGLHLSRCGVCKRRLEEMRRLRLALLESPRIPVPNDFSAGWRAEIRREAPTPATAGRYWLAKASVMAPVAACLLAIVTGAVLFFPRERGGGLLKSAVDAGRSARLAPKVPASERGSEPQNRILAEALPTDQPRAATPRLDHPAEPKAAAPPTPAAGVQSESATPWTAAGKQDDLDRAATTKSLGVFSQAGFTGRDELASVDLTWRVWLTDLGTRPTAVRQILADSDFPVGSLARMVLDLPLLVRGGLTHQQAEELAARFEEAGAHVMVDSGEAP